MSPRRSAVLLLIAALVCLSVVPVSAQLAQSAVSYPTVTALDAAVIPVRDRVELAERLRGVTDVPPTPAWAPSHQVGESQRFTATNATDNTTFTIPATLRVVGQHIYLWVEDGADVSDGDLQALADDFDTHIYKDVRDLWGSEANPGVDGDPRIYGLFAHGLGAGTAAYFASDHTYPREVVPYSNQHEMFFFNLDALSGDFPLTAVESTVAHEFQHMIRFNLQSNTETWLNEGLSVFTQFYLFNQLDSSTFSFLQQPGTQLDDWNPNPGERAANYGAATMFLIYFYQRYGLDAMRDLSADHRLRGLQAVDDVLRARGQPGVDDFFADWVLANYLYDPGFEGGRYGYGTLPALMTPTTQAAVTQYPFMAQGQVNQYAADYYALGNLGGVQALDLHLTSPASVGLIPTVPDGHFWYSNRGDMADTRLTHAFDLSGVAHATLDYRLWYDNESLWDYGYVMVSGDDGAHWDALSTAHTSADDPHGVTYGAGYTGASGGWIDESLPLDAYAGKQILVRFELITDDAVNRPGMALDDLSIPEIGYSDDFNADDGGWQPEGWLWSDNRLPEQTWLLVGEQSGGKTVAVERWLNDGVDHRVALAPGVDQVVVAVAPYAPVTTVPMPYTLSVSAESAR